MAYYGTNGQFGGGMQNPNYGWNDQFTKTYQNIAGGGTNAAMNAVNAGIPYANEIRDQQFAAAGARLGQSGFGASTPYANALGDASRRATNDITQSYWNTVVPVSENIAQRSWQGGQNAADRNLARGLQTQNLQAQDWRDYWNRYYNYTVNDYGSPDYYNYWQGAGNMLYNPRF